MRLPECSPAMSVSGTAQGSPPRRTRSRSRLWGGGGRFGSAKARSKSRLSVWTWRDSFGARVIFCPSGAGLRRIWKTDEARKRARSDQIRCSWPAPAFGERGAAQGDQRFAIEPAAEHQEARGAFPFEQNQRLGKLAPGLVALAAAPGQQPKMQPGHGEGGIEIGGDAIMLGAGGGIAGILAAQCQHIMSAGRH